MKKIFSFAVFAVILALAAGGCSDKVPGKTTVVFKGPENMTMSFKGRKLKGLTRKMAPGEYFFKFEAPGFYPLVKRVKITENQPGSTETVTMERERAAVYFTAAAAGIDGDAGAAVFHNGKPVGTTPGMLYDLAPGRHSFKFALRGYADHTVELDLNDPRPVRINTVMVSTSGQLIVRGKPDKASVYLDGKFVGLLPWSGKTEAGKIKVEVRAEGYMPQSGEFTLDNGKTLRVNMDLAPAPGSITVNSKPENAAVYLKDEKIGTTPCKIENLKPGNYRITLKHDGFDNWERLVELKAGSNEVIDADMASEFGSVRIQFRPAGLDVFIDGKFAGRTQSAPGRPGETLPMEIGNIAPGRHRIMATHPEANPVQTFVNVEVHKGKLTVAPQKDIWVANAILINHSGEEEKGVVVYEMPDAVMFSPFPGVRKEIKLRDIKEKREINVEKR